MDDAIHLVIFHEGEHRIKIADISLHEYIVWLILDILQIGQIACICQLVHIDDAVLRILVYKKTNYMAADKTGTACDDYVSAKTHIFFKHFFNESSHCGIATPNISLTLDLSRTE